MSRRLSILRLRWLILLTALIIVTTTALAGSANAATGTVVVTATNAANISITIADSTSAFGSSLAPDGTGASGEISSVTGSTGNQGAYYVWTPSSTPLIIVKSNKTWNGTVSASENAGTATSMTVASGALRYNTSAPGTYSAAAASTAMSTTASSWATNAAKGVSTFTHYYVLRVDWDDDPGTFSSTVTYSVIQ